MDLQRLQFFLGNLAAHSSDASSRKQREQLRKNLSRSLVREDLEQSERGGFAFESADVFTNESTSRNPDELLSSIAIGELQLQEPEFRVFTREVPLRAMEMYGSVPEWASGATPDTTIGSFQHLDGREVWFDFYKIEKLVALYVQGKPHPALLFKITGRTNFVNANLPLTTDMRTSYRLVQGSVWINSQVLAASAPDDHYTGLTIRGGGISLSVPPQIVDGKLTVAASTVVTVELQLQQPAIAESESRYGVDARAAEVSVPDGLAFHFSNSNTTLDGVASARWRVYDHEATFSREENTPAVYDTALRRVNVPLTCSEREFEIRNCRSAFHTIKGRARIRESFWTLPAAPIDVANPTSAAGIGAIAIKCDEGLTDTWSGLRGDDFALAQPLITAQPGSISVGDASAGNVFCEQHFDLWKDDLSPHGTSIDLRFPSPTTFFYITAAEGSEALMVKTNADVKIDRPVTIAGAALAIHSKNSQLVLAATEASRRVYLFDADILLDNIDATKQPPAPPEPIAFALHNALFKTTPANGCFLFGQLAEDFVKVEQANLYLTFGMYAYLPMLPDPYAANLANLQFQFRENRENFGVSSTLAGARIWLWLVCQIKWQPHAPVEGEVKDDEVAVSFHFAPLQNQFATNQFTESQFVQNLNAPQSSLTPSGANAAANDNANQPFGAAFANIGAAFANNRLPDYAAIWDENTRALRQETFALLDVSTNADLLGVSFNVFDERRMSMIRTHTVASNQTTFPLQVKGMDVVSRATNVRAFMLPQISWEPVFNFPPPLVAGNAPPPPPVAGDPSVGFNYYPDDGGATRLINNSAESVALAPIPLTNFLVDSFDDEKFAAFALFTLPFGIKALALLQKRYKEQGVERRGNQALFNSKSFDNDIKGARQIELDGGEALVKGESDAFIGSTLQINNVLEFDGTSRGNSTLGGSVTDIFNREFMLEPFNLFKQRGVPLTRMDLSGYGASIFSNWLNPKATIAATSQAKFDVFVGRCAHEIIQVKSIMYPWAIKVVRTITLFRAGSGYVYRYDSGWRAESEGVFDFTYFVNVRPDGKLTPEERPKPLPLPAPPPHFEIHPGALKGLFNVKDIQETEEIKPFTGKMIIRNGELYVDENGEELTNTSGADKLFDYELQPVFFNADAEIENPISGFVTKTFNGQEKRVVPSKRILGFVQIAPRGMPISKHLLRLLIDRQQGSIGAPVDCVVNIANSNQQMRVHRFDVSNSVAANNSDPIFVAACRGNVVLPKDGSWSLVKHTHATGEVTPVPQDLSVPLIRRGMLRKENNQLVLDKNANDELLRVADPTELLRQPVDGTINYGFLHSTDTQKALFLTPSYKQSTEKLLSKTPPLFADAFRIVNSKSVFPNVGNAVTNFGDAVSLVKKGTEFKQNTLPDGKKVYELMQIDNVGGGIKQEGYKLLKQFDEFDLPNKEWTLIEIGGAFKIYIEYKAGNATGNLNFDVDSFAGGIADKWKSLMSNVGIVVDLGFIKRLMTIKGDWNAQNGAEADFPAPQIEFAPELKAVIEILQILQELQGENYKEAFARGLKLAMSNKAGTWEYKFDAAKEIPVLRFPPGFLYNDPNAPLKLEAGLRLGAYYNAALKVTTDPKQLLPTAGGFFGFYGKMSVMCISLSVATIYAVGQVNLDIGADTQAKPTLRMKFGFGAQVVIGLPVVGNVSVLYMVGVEIFSDSTTLNVSAFLLFQGHAELLAGLVGVTITIEAKGTVSRANKRTDLAAQVTFGLDISIFLVIDIEFSTSWQEQRQIA